MLRIKQSTSSNPKSDKASRQMDKKLVKNQDSKKASMGPKGQPSKRLNRKGENPIRISPITEPGSGSRFSSTWMCRNSACRAMLSIVDTFCKRCSCCICHLFDDNKDPSLWLECASDSPAGSCGLSCHIECALQQRKVGVVDLGQVTQLDGSYCCACGKISGILGYWKKQVTIAKDCRRVDSLCYRLNLCYRLFNGTSRFKNLDTIINEAKETLESELGPLGGVSARLARGIVSRLTVAAQVQALCSAAIEKAEEILETLSTTRLAESSGPQIEGTSGAKDAEPDKVGDSGKRLQLTWVDERGDFDDISGPELSGPGQMVNPDTSKAGGSPFTSSGLDLNIVTVPDLNEDAALNDSPRDEADHRSGGSGNWARHGPIGELLAVDSQAEIPRKRPASTEAHDSDSALIHISPSPAPGNLDQNYEYCVRMIRGLEREGHITPEFRLKLLTWFSLRSTQHERRVVNTFIRTLGDDPSCLAAQLVDSFGYIINTQQHNA